MGRRQNTGDGSYMVHMNVFRIFLKNAGSHIGELPAAFSAGKKRSYYMCDGRS